MKLNTKKQQNLFLKLWLNNHLILKSRMAILENQVEYRIQQVLDVIRRETLLFLGNPNSHTR